MSDEDQSLQGSGSDLTEDASVSSYNPKSDSEDSRSSIGSFIVSDGASTVNSVVKKRAAKKPAAEEPATKKPTTRSAQKQMTNVVPKFAKLSSPKPVDARKILGKSRVPPRTINNKECNNSEGPRSIKNKQCNNSDGLVQPSTVTFSQWSSPNGAKRISVSFSTGTTSAKKLSTKKKTPVKKKATVTKRPRKRMACHRNQVGPGPFIETGNCPPGIFDESSSDESSNKMVCTTYKVTYTNLFGDSSDSETEN